MEGVDKISLKFKHHNRKIIRKDIRIVLHKQHFMDKTNVLQVPSNIDKKISKICQKQTKAGNKENVNMKKTQIVDRNLVKKLDGTSQKELYININSLPRNKVANCSKIEEANTALTVSPKCLRTKVRRNYAEMSVGISPEVALPNSFSTKKVPIYRNQQIGEEKTKAPMDLYEFDEIDNVGTKKYRKRHFNDSEKFDKSTYDILQKIKMKEAKLQAKNKRKAGTAGKPRKYNKPSNKPIQEIKESQAPGINHPDELNDDATSDHGDEGTFDFAEVAHSTPVRANPNIKIIGNVIVNEQDSPDFLDDLQPDAHSTMLPSDKHNPWRYNENLKRNPHFISIKKTALPCLQQDLVLDYDQLGKTAHVTKSLKQTETPKKKLVQKSIMDFMDVSPSSCEMNDKENAPRSNLFDYDEFSPKKVTPSRNFSKSKIRRNILGAIQDNFENIQANTGSTPNKASLSLAPLIESDKNNDVDTYFGFDDDNELVLSGKTSKLSEARPYRINRIVHRKPVEEAAEAESLGHGGNLTEFQESLDCQAEGDGKEVGLFEDPEQQISLNMPSKIYERKRRKRRLLSVDVDEEESPKKKKNMMTKKEEAELEKWAAQFNSECEEIEKYKLEIE